MTFCREYISHITTLWMGAAVFFLGFISGTMKSCGNPKSQAQEKHEHELEKLELEYRLRNKISGVEREE